MTANHLGPYNKTLTWSYVEYAMIPSAAEGLVEEPGIRLITQRSQVQILPPLQENAQVRGRFPGQQGSGLLIIRPWLVHETQGPRRRTGRHGTGSGAIGHCRFSSLRDHRHKPPCEHSATSSLNQ